MRFAIQRRLSDEALVVGTVGTRVLRIQLALPFGFLLSDFILSSAMDLTTTITIEGMDLLHG